MMSKIIFSIRTSSRKLKILKIYITNSKVFTDQRFLISRFRQSQISVKSSWTWANWDSRFKLAYTKQLRLWNGSNILLQHKLFSRSPTNPKFCLNLKMMAWFISSQNMPKWNPCYRITNSKPKNLSLPLKAICRSRKFSRSWWMMWDNKSHLRWDPLKRRARSPSRVFRLPRFYRLKTNKCSHLSPSRPQYTLCSLRATKTSSKQDAFLTCPTFPWRSLTVAIRVTNSWPTNEHISSTHFTHNGGHHILFQ